jgi:hypothetical protein
MLGSKIMQGSIPTVHTYCATPWSIMRGWRSKGNLKSVGSSTHKKAVDVDFCFYKLLNKFTKVMTYFTFEVTNSWSDPVCHPESFMPQGIRINGLHSGTRGHLFIHWSSRVFITGECSFILGMAHSAFLKGRFIFMDKAVKHSTRMIFTHRSGKS